MAQLKKSAKKSVKKSTTRKNTVVKFTSEQKKEIQLQIALAVEEAYFQGREDEARDQEKAAAARKKAIDAVAAKFDKDRKKSEKKTVIKSKSKKTEKKVNKVKNAKKNVVSTLSASIITPKKRGRPAKTKIAIIESQHDKNIITPTEK